MLKHKKTVPLFLFFEGQNSNDDSRLHFKNILVGKYVFILGRVLLLLSKKERKQSL